MTRVWVLVMLLAFPTDAREADQQARAAYAQGLAYYQAGEYALAVAQFKHAYQIEPLPMLLFNIGQAYRMQKDYGHALEAYGSYLRMLPNAPNRADVERWIIESSAHLSEAPAVAAVAVPAAVPLVARDNQASPARVVTRRHRAALISGLVLMGVGLAAIGTGAYFAVRRSNDVDELAALRAGHAAWDDHAQAVWNDGVDSAAAADALFVTGGVLTAGGLALTIVGARQREEPVQLAAVWTCAF